MKKMTNVNRVMTAASSTAHTSRLTTNVSTGR
jgi:hypothetical protein